MKQFLHALATALSFFKQVFKHEFKLKAKGLRLKATCYLSKKPNTQGFSGHSQARAFQLCLDAKLSKDQGLRIFDRLTSINLLTIIRSRVYVNAILKLLQHSVGLLSSIIEGKELQKIYWVSLPNLLMPVLKKREKVRRKILSMNPSFTQNTALAFAASRNEPPQKPSKQMAQRWRFGPFALQQKDLTWLVKKPERLEGKAQQHMVFDSAQTDKNRRTQGLLQPPLHIPKASGFAMTSVWKVLCKSINSPFTPNPALAFAAVTNEPTQNLSKQMAQRRLYSKYRLFFKGLHVFASLGFWFLFQLKETCGSMLERLNNTIYKSKKQLGLAGYEAGKVEGKGQQQLTFNSVQTDNAFSSKKPNTQGLPQPLLHITSTSGFAMTDKRQGKCINPPLAFNSAIAFDSLTKKRGDGKTPSLELACGMKDRFTLILFKLFNDFYRLSCIRFAQVWCLFHLRKKTLELARSRGPERLEGKALLGPAVYEAGKVELNGQRLIVLIPALYLILILNPFII